jgi:serine/threonine protein kinase/tetratricopeptide (TPR) repeat protein
MDERYQRAKKVFLAVCDLEAAELAAALDRECGDDAELRADVESLLAHQDAPTATIGGVGPDLAPRGEAGEPMRIGAYRVIRELGRGGMGVVYLGMREDDQFKRRVAIKVLKRGMDTDEILRRFELERQLLAALNHPGIARLYDGGQTDDGLPYFAMEYVEGQPIDVYCDTHRLRIGERLELFRTVCSAIHYAHQNLVVHRDLKPGNIIVTGDGVPKLLDFGIAKLINPELSLIRGDPTAPELRVMTPEYASPEQVRGDPITTASDVYALGVLLYELVTGHRPYRLGSRVKAEIEHVICDVDPERPSTAVSRVEEFEPDESGAPGTAATITPETVSRVREGRPDRLRRRLAGDIDNMVLMAMRKEPQRRYTSAEQFAEDLRRHLVGLPVIARRDTIGYRSRKFVRRHRVGVAAAAVIVLSLLGGISGTSWQATVAGRERDRAEARFDQVRELARIFMFDFHEKIRNLEGSLPARELLVTTALEYLDGLALDVGDDVDLRRDLASGYDRVGEILSGERGESLGQTASALEHYRTALALREAALREAPGDLKLQQEVSVAHQHVGDMLKKVGDLEGALHSYRRQLELGESLFEANPKNTRVLATALANVGAVMYRTGRLEEARLSYERSQALRKLYLQERPDSGMALRDVSVGALRVGEVLNAVGDVEGALGQYEQAVEYRQRIVDAEPHNGRARRDLALAHFFAAQAMLSLGRVEEAKPHIDHFLTVAQQRLADNPTSARAKVDLAIAYVIQGAWRAETDGLEGAMASYRECQSVIVPVSEADPGAELYRDLVAESHHGMAEVLERQDKLTAAGVYYERALEIVTALSTENPKEVRLQLKRAQLLSALGALLLETGEPLQAREKLDEARGLLEVLRVQQPEHAETRHELTLALYRLSRVMDRLGDPAAATALAEEAWALIEGAPPGPKTTEMRRDLEGILDARGAPD